MVTMAANAAASIVARLSLTNPRDTLHHGHGKRQNFKTVT